MDDETKLGCGLFVLLALSLPFLFGGCYAGSKIEVSDGYRDATIRKVSETGILWKTTEVETLGDGLRLHDSRMTPETFTYTVADVAVTKQLEAVQPGKKVRLWYRKFLTAWQPNGETRYRITKVEDAK